MHGTSFWTNAATLLAVLGPLVGIPLTVIVFYLRGLRDQQVAWHAELIRRFEAVEQSTSDLRRHVDQFERDYTTKEEWLRECLHARRVLENLTETTVRLDATMTGVLATLRGFDSRPRGLRVPIGAGEASKPKESDHG